MNNSQQHLHSDNFDLCRICLLEPESNRDIQFFHIFLPSNDGYILNEAIKEFLNLHIEEDDPKPKIICGNCHKIILGWLEIKKKSFESQIVINYIERKRYANIPGIPASAASKRTDVSSHSRNNNESTNSSLSLQHSLSNNSNTRLRARNNCSSISSTTQDNLSQSISNIQPSIDNQTSDFDDNASCQEVSIVDEVICISDDEDAEKPRKFNYCSICKKRKMYNHDCSQFNKEFSTCLVPNCNILCRSTRDFTPHYRQHMGLPVGAVLCRCCFKEKKKSERDENGCHTNCITLNLFKCYACNLDLDSMAEFAFHKFKLHNARLMNSSGNYLCFFCEKSSSDLMNINEHIKHCRENQTKTLTECEMEPKEAAENITAIGKTGVKNAIESSNEKGDKIPSSSQHVLFTCLKPSCNYIFQNFAIFKAHHRLHFKTGNYVMCWQCCSPFRNKNYLRTHQVKGNCRIPGMFKCYECSKKYNDIQGLSIHKYITHNGELVPSKNNKKTIMCSHCKVGIIINDFKTHIKECKSKKEKKITSQPKSIKKIKCPSVYCEICGKVCLTNAALSSHIKIHSRRSKKEIKTVSNTSTKRKYSELSNSKNETNEEKKPNLLNTSENNKSIKLDDSNIQVNCSTSYVSTKSNECSVPNTSNSKETYEDINTTLASTTQINGSVNSENCDVSIISNIKETEEDISLVSNISMITTTDNDINYVTSPCVELSSHSKSPNTLGSKKGRSRHYCSRLATKVTSKSLTQNYYCTKCKEYFTRFGFRDHWKSSHGKRLRYHKNKQFVCTNCSCKFVYKIALLMHKKHKHSDPNKDINCMINETPINSSSGLQEISNTENLDSEKNDENGFTNCNENLFLPVIFSVRSLASEKNETPIENNLINCSEKQLLPPICSTISLDSNKSETIKEDEHKTCNGITDDENTNTSLKNNNNVKLENEIEHIIKQNNKVNESENNKEEDLNLLCNDNKTIDIQENISPGVNQVKEGDGVIEEQICVENTMVVHEGNEIEENQLPVECETIVKKEMTKINKSEKNINTVIIDNQNYWE